MNTCVAPRADHNLAGQPHSRSKEPEFPVAMSRLVQVHEVHINGGPREFFVELCVQVEMRFSKGAETADPHSSRRKTVHPRDQADALARTGGIQAQLLDGPTGGDYRLSDDFYRDDGRRGKRGSDRCSVLLHYLQRIWSIQVLAAGDKPRLQP